MRSRIAPWIVSFMIVLCSTPALASESTNPLDQPTAHPGQAVETAYAEAVLAYNGKNFGRALELLDSLLKVSPENVEALELEALTYKTEGKDRESLESYKKLIRLKAPKDRGPYYFEAGMIYYRHKEYQNAMLALERASLLGFNRGPAEYFMGNAALQLHETAQAEYHLRKVLGTDSNELKVVAHYSLGLLYFQQGYGSGATHELIAARDLARQIPESKTAQEVSTAAVKALAPYDRAQWFGNFSLLTQYDGNVSLESSNATDSAASGKASLKEILGAGFGKMSSPMRAWQWVASYRLSYNKNFDPELKDYEFLSNVPSLYLTRNPLARTSYGLKLEGNWTFRNTVSASGTSATFRPYQVSLEAGPYLRSELVRHTQVNLELFARPENYPQDPSSGADRRSGTTLTARVGAKQDLSNRLLNPEASLSYVMDLAQGTNFRSRTIGLDLSNEMRVSARDTVTFGGSVGLASYSQALPVRNDQTYSLRLSWIRTMTRAFSLVGDAEYVTNASNVDTYSYSKPSVSLGISYTL